MAGEARRLEKGSQTSRDFASLALDGNANPIGKITLWH